MILYSRKSTAFLWSGGWALFDEGVVVSVGPHLARLVHRQMWLLPFRRATRTRKIPHDSRRTVKRQKRQCYRTRSNGFDLNGLIYEGLWNEIISSATGTRNPVCYNEKSLAWLRYYNVMSGNITFTSKYSSSSAHYSKWWPFVTNLFPKRRNSFPKSRIWISRETGLPFYAIF